MRTKLPTSSSTTATARPNGPSPTSSGGLAPLRARLQLELQPGDRAILVYPPGLDFIAAFFGCMYAGVVAVPATYPKPRRPMPRLSRIAIDCDAHVALSTAATLTTLDPELLSKDAATSQWIATDELPDALADRMATSAGRRQLTLRFCSTPRAPRATPRA